MEQYLIIFMNKTNMSSNQRYDITHKVRNIIPFSVIDIYTIISTSMVKRQNDFAFIEVETNCFQDYLMHRCTKKIQLVILTI